MKIANPGDSFIDFLNLLLAVYLAGGFWKNMLAKMKPLESWKKPLESWKNGMSPRLVFYKFKVYDFPLSHDP